MSSNTAKIDLLNKKIDIPEWAEVEKTTLSNGIPVHILHSGNEDIVRFEIIFRAGSKYQDKIYTSSTASSMLKEGSLNYTSSEIAEKFDFHGAYFSNLSDRDWTSLILICLKKHFKEMLELVKELILNPVFPENEFKTYITKKKQLYLLEQEKVSTLARNQFNRVLFGEKHPYGVVGKYEDYDVLSPEDLKSFHQSLFHHKNSRILLSGKIDGEETKILEESLGGVWGNSQVSLIKPDMKAFQTGEKVSYISKKDAVQASIRIGKRMINKKHEDFYDLFVLNTVLGGYFGSRLMKNIREEKGYTYGIGSLLVSLEDSGFWFITSEVGGNVHEQARKEIYHEINRLCATSIPREELQIVKNYISGEILRQVDGPFSIAESYRSLWDYALDFEYYEKFITRLHEITPEVLRETALKYFEPGIMYEVTAGPEK